MLPAADTVAGEQGISRAELDDVVAIRYGQYERALADDRAIQRQSSIPG